MLQHGELVPSLNFETPNPRLDLAAGPFVVNTAHRPWPGGTEPRRAGVSSFGIGGTNAHAILEEAPARAEPGPTRARQLLVWSAKSQAASRPRPDAWPTISRRARTSPDTAYTLALGRHAFELRRFAVCAGASEGEKILRDPGAPRPPALRLSAPAPSSSCSRARAPNTSTWAGPWIHTEPVYRAAFEQAPWARPPRAGRRPDRARISRGDAG